MPDRNRQRIYIGDIYIYVCVYVCIYIYIYMCMCVYIHTHTKEEVKQSINRLIKHFNFIGNQIMQNKMLRWHLLKTSSIGSAQLLSCVRLCDPMDCSTPSFPVHHQLSEPTQTHVHCISDGIQPSRSLLSHSPSTFNLSQHQGLFQ